MEIKNGMVLGVGELPIKCAKLLQDKGINVTLIETIKANFSHMEARCKILDIKYCKMSPQTLENLYRLPPNTIIVSASNTYVFNENILCQPNVLVINYHNSLLPIHRGMNAEAWSIYVQDKETGVTWHKVDNKIDTGDIFYQQKIEILPDETSLQLLMRQSELAYSIFSDNIDNIISGIMYPYKQEGDTNYHKISDIPNNGYIADAWEFSKTYAFLRSMDYGPMHVLGYPKIYINDDIYVWNSYTVEKTNIEFRDIAIINDKIILNYRNNCIKLMSAQRYL